MVEISVVIPVYNEAEIIGHVATELVSVLDNCCHSYEVLLVNDGSTDRTGEIISYLCKENPHIKQVLLDNRYGQTAALHAGIKLAKGKKIVTMDGDGQNDPSDIPKLLELSKEYDVVCGWRINRQDTYIRKISSKIANSLRRKVLGDSIPDIGCTLKIYPAKKIKTLNFYDGFHRFLPILLELEGCSIVSVPVNHRPRQRGLSKYNIRNRLFKTTIDMLVVKWMKKRMLFYKLRK